MFRPQKGDADRRSSRRFPAPPLRSQIDAAADEAELEDVYDTERQLLYVAATRAHDRLLVNRREVGSEFLRDLER
jgi:superfamily I DNA/RNA helicase